MKRLILILIIASLITTTLACNGMQIQDLKINNCDGEDLLRNINFTAKLDKDCNVVPSGCFIVKNAIESGNISYSMRKNGMPPLKFGGKKSICPLLASSKGSPEVMLALKLVKVPDRCPIQEGNICATGSMSVAKYGSHLQAAEGSFNGKLTAITNAGKICMTMTLKMVKENTA